MIIHDWQGELAVIYQMDHCDLAAQFQRLWGNTEFAAAEPREAMAYAAYWHDNGWVEYDQKPRVNPQTRRPYRLGELGSSEHLEFYEACINKIIGENPYAGLMVSMHLSGLYQQRYGMDSDLPNLIEVSGDKERVSAFIQGIEQGQAELRARLAAGDEFKAAVQRQWLWTNYKFMQVFDRLSLFFCFFSPGMSQTVTPAPKDYQGNEVQLTLTALDASRIAVSPFPFANPETVVTLRAKLIANRDYADDADVRSTLASAPFEEFSYTLAPAS